MKHCLRLVLFDCDGTLADSEHAIIAAMRAAFAAHALPAPRDRAIRETIGLSVPHAIARLLPDSSDDQRATVSDAYRDMYFQHRAAAASAPEPLYDGITEVVQRLYGDGWQLGVATGKSQRGLLRLLDAHGLTDRFVTLQTADFHPSKPDPSMVYAALDQTLVAAENCIVVGDTSFDMAMARAAGARAVGVAWGYHSADALRAAGAEDIADTPQALLDIIARIAGETV